MIFEFFEYRTRYLFWAWSRPKIFSFPFFSVKPQQIHLSGPHIHTIPTCIFTGSGWIRSIIKIFHLFLIRVLSRFVTSTVNDHSFIRRLGNSPSHSFNSSRRIASPLFFQLIWLTNLRHVISVFKRVFCIRFTRTIFWF